MIARLVKKLHMYTGLLSFSALLVYGIAGLTATLERAPDKRLRPEPSVRYQALAIPAGLSDKEAADYVYRELKLPLSSPVPGFAVRRNRENNLALDFYTVNGMQRVIVLEKENRMRIETARNNVWRFVNGLHTTTTEARSPDQRVRLWKYYNEFAIWSLLGMAASGIYLWLASRPGHRWAQIFFAAGSGAFLALYFITR